MNRIFRRIALPVLGTVALLALLPLLRRTHYVVPSFSVPPLSTTPSRLTVVQVQEILLSNFTVVRKVQEVPAVIKDDYTAITHNPFWMVNDGEPVSTDAIIPGVPNEQLVLLGLADENAVLVYEAFGFVGCSARSFMYQF